MKPVILAIMLGAIALSAQNVPNEAKKREAVALVEKQQAQLVLMADQIWSYAEVALREHKSAKMLADHAEKNGFRVERGVAGMPTAFTATYGSGKPVIAILGEYDALPGISQKASATQEAVTAGAAGHGCGHNLFGSASLGAAIAVKELMAAGKLKGTVRFYGTPAEESIGGKVFMLKAGLFRDVDAALVWHPADQTSADTDSSQAVVDLLVEFHGRTAHAAADPWNGRSALDGLELFHTGLNWYREHVRPTVRMHYVVRNGGNVPNVIPDRASSVVWLRDSKRAGVDVLFARIRDIAKGAGLMSGTEAKISIQSGYYEMLANMAGSRALHKNITWLGPVQFSEEEQQFARAIQKSTGVPEKGVVNTIEPLDEKPGEPKGGSTDVGDVSWNMPTVHLSMVTAAKDAPWHAWPTVAASGMGIGRKGMMQASKVLAATAVDLFEDAALLAAMKSEWQEKTKGFAYKPFAEGEAPVPKD